jgi:type I restriction enzyme S subunit
MGYSSIDSWRKVVLRDVLETVIDYRGKTPPKCRSGIPTLTAANVKQGRIDLSAVTYVSEATYQRWITRGLPKAGDVLITTEAPVGEVAPFPGDQTYLMTRRVIALRGKDDELHNKYLLYALMSPQIQSYIYGRVRGTTVSRILKPDILDMRIEIPGFDEQKAIAHILGTIDDKIELNRQMNATLESMAKALFKSWFVDFDPVIDNALAAGNPIPEPLQARAEVRQALGDKRKPLPEAIRLQFPDQFVFTEKMGWVPEGWESIPLGDALELAYGKSLPAPKRIEGKVPVYGSGGLSGYHNEALIQGPAIVVGRKGTVGSLYWVDDPLYPIDTVFYVKQKIDYLPLYWIFQTLQQLDIKSMGADSAVPGVNRNAVYGARIMLAPEEVLRQYWKFISSIPKKVMLLGAECKSLSSLRDTLLPKLLSGELRIPDAEKLVAEVG